MLLGEIYNQICTSGGMVDALASEVSDRKVVRVRIPFRARTRMLY